MPAAAQHCDAFVCANDRIAGYFMHALLGQGIRIPNDVRLVGIDDVSYAGLLPVPLTTVHQPCREIGEAALRLMLERIDRPKMAARNVLLDGSLVIRRSCGRCLADRDRLPYGRGSVKNLPTTPLPNRYRAPTRKGMGRSRTGNSTVTEPRP